MNNFKTCVVIDGANAHSMIKACKRKIDWAKFKDWCDHRWSFPPIYYYTAILPAVRLGLEQNSIMNLYNYLQYSGYIVQIQDASKYTDDTQDSGFKIKGNVDVNLTVDVMQMSDYFDHFVFFTGDGDFNYLLEALRKKGKRTTVLGIVGISSDSLRRNTEFIPLLENSNYAEGEQDVFEL